MKPLPPYIHKCFSQKKLWAILSIGFFLVAITAKAAPPAPFEDPTTSGSFEQILLGIARFVWWVGVPVLGFFIVWTGAKFVSAQGDEKKLTEARQMLVWVLVGGAIVLGAGTIAQIIINFALIL